MKIRDLIVLMLCLFILTLAGNAFAQSVAPSTGVTTPDASGTAAAVSVAILQFLTSAKVSMIAAWIIQAMKNSKLQVLAWINHNTPGISKIVSFVAAVGAAAGITFTYNQAGDFVIHGLLLAAVGKAVWHTIINYGMQKGWYKQVFNDVAPGVAPPMRAKVGAV